MENDLFITQKKNMENVCASVSERKKRKRKDKQKKTKRKRKMYKKQKKNIYMSTK